MVNTANSSPTTTEGPSKGELRQGHVAERPHRPDDESLQGFLMAEILQNLHDSTYTR